MGLSTNCSCPWLGHTSLILSSLWLAPLSCQKLAPPSATDWRQWSLFSPPIEVYCTVKKSFFTVCGNGPPCCQSSCRSSLAQVYLCAYHLSTYQWVRHHMNGCDLGVALYGARETTKRKNMIIGFAYDSAAGVSRLTCVCTPTKKSYRNKIICLSLKYSKNVSVEGIQIYSNWYESVLPVRVDCGLGQRNKRVQEQCFKTQSFESNEHSKKLPEDS